MSTEWIYGFHAIESALKSNLVLQIYLNDKRLDKRVEELLKLVKGKSIPVNMVGINTINDKVGEDARHQGIIAEVKVKPAENENFLFELIENLDKSPLLLVLDGVTDPHNVGACLRSAEAFGVDAVIVPKDKACGLTPVVRKISSGSSERVPFVEVVNLARTLELLKEKNIWLTGMDGDAKETIYEANLTGGLAIIMGSEGTGMRRLTQSLCDFMIKIPMEGAIESLNVSVATGVVLSESYRQRNMKKK